MKKDHVEQQKVQAPSRRLRLWQAVAVAAVLTVCFILVGGGSKTATFTVEDIDPAPSELNTPIRVDNPKDKPTAHVEVDEPEITIYCDRSAPNIDPVHRHSVSSPYNDTNPRCVDRKIVSERYRKVVDTLDRLQKQDCNDPKTKYILYYPFSKVCGFGCGSSQIVHALELSMILEHTLVLTPLEKWWAYWDNNTCPTREYQCYWESLHDYSLCDTRKLWDSVNMKPVEDIFVTNTSDDSLRINAPKEWEKYDRFWLSKTFWGIGVPPRKFKLHVYRYQAALMDYVLRPNDELKSILAAEKERLNFDSLHPIIALHVRKGDAALDRRKMPEFEDFMNAANELRKLHGVKNIYLMANSLKVLNETKKYPDWNFYTEDKRTMSKNGWYYGKSRFKGLQEARDKKTDAYSAFTSLLIGRECDMFVGTLSSNFGGTAFKLMIAHKGGVIPPYISLGGSGYMV